MSSLQLSESYFFVGLAGAGMSAIAQYLAGKGYSIGGSDRQFSDATPPLVQKQLEQMGIQCFLQNGSGVSKAYSAVVVSTAIEETNPDIIKAKTLGLKIFHRSEILSLISKSVKTIAVSGTSGKSTVTAMIFHVLDYAGLSPSMITGAGLVSLEKKGKIGNAVAGNGEWLVVEADESDGTLVRYEPEIGVILNLDKDHKELTELNQIFSTFAHQILDRGKFLIVNDAHSGANQFSAGREFDFGFENHVAVQGTDFSAIGTGIRFRVRYGNELVRFELPFPGRHNMENALAAIAVALRVGVSLRTIAEALTSFSGIYRRHQILGSFSGITLIDDFAHNPAKIAASLRSVQAFTEGRVIAWFQPHGFGPTRFLRKEFVSEIKAALRVSNTDSQNDCIFFSDIYYAGGTVVKDISSADLVDDLLEEGVEAYYLGNRNECAKRMVSLANSSDCILLMGARDPSLGDFANHVKELLQGLK